MSVAVVDLLLVLSPVLILVVGGLALMVADAFAGERAECGLLAFVIFMSACAASLGLTLTETSLAPPEYFTNYLAMDRLGLFFDVVICLGGGLCALLASGYLKEHGLERGEFYALLIFSSVGAIVLARAVDLLTLFIGLETMSLGVYALVGFRRTSARAAEGAAKYFLLGSFAAAILLFGSALLYGATGHTNFAGIGESIRGGTADEVLIILSMAMLLVGLTFKISAVPFHMWTPDAYEGAVTPATTFMSVVVKAAAFAVTVRVLLVCFGDELSMSVATGWPPVVAGLAAITMVYGNLAAVGQSSVKRMLAYSSIAHAGYILVGVAAVVRAEEAAVSGVLYYLIAYTVSNVLAFGSLIAVGSKGREAVSYEDLAGVGRRHPLAALPFVVGVLSLMGMPPTAGFFGKYYVFSAAVDAGGGLVWLAILGVVMSTIGAYYYLRVIVFMFMKEPQAGAVQAIPMRSGWVAASLAISGLMVLQFGLWPGWYIDLAKSAAQQLIG